jgi:hypothetical protein
MLRTLIKGTISRVINMKKGKSMKNRKKTTIIALMLMLAMVITSEAFVFAADGVDEGTGSSDTQTVEEQGTPADDVTPDVTEPETTDPEATEPTDPEEVGEEVADEEQTEESEEAAEAAPATDLTNDVPDPVVQETAKAYPGYKSVTLRWKKVDNVKYYLVMRSTKPDSGFERRTLLDAENKDYSITIDGDEYMNFRDAKDIEKNTRYYYRIYSRKYLQSTSTEVLSEEFASVNAMSVRPIYEKFSFKVTKKLKSHDKSGNIWHTFKKGESYVAEGFGGGCYKFYYKGHLFYAYYTRVNKTTSNYMKKTNYTLVTAENFVNEYGRKKSSKSNYLIWVSTYTQHLYIYKWNKSLKKWKVYKHWECSTGKAASPSPTGFTESLNSNKMSSHSGIKWWSPYRSMNAIHGKRSSYKIDGAPHSHGCIRNYDKNAKWIYSYCKPGTPLIVN